MSISRDQNHIIVDKDSFPGIADVERGFESFHFTGIDGAVSRGTFSWPRQNRTVILLFPMIFEAKLSDVWQKIA